jgi:hypothetical protein
VAFYDQTTKNTQIINVQEIQEISITSAPYPVPNITTTTIPQALIPVVAKSDTGLQSVITQITQSSVKYVLTNVTSVEVNVYDENTTQYSVIMDVKGQKEQLVQIFNKTSNVVTPVSVTQVPINIQPILYT